jgi:hypothetical protein
MSGMRFTAFSASYGLGDSPRPVAPTLRKSPGR